MKLNEFMKRDGIKHGVFSRRIGISRYGLTKILKGTTDIHLSIAYRIEEITEGKVTCKDMVNKKSLENLKERSKQLIEEFEQR